MLNLIQHLIPRADHPEPWPIVRAGLFQGLGTRVGHPELVSGSNRRFALVGGSSA